MAENRNYTTDEMREAANALLVSDVASYISVLADAGGGRFKAIKGQDIVGMLEQAAAWKDELDTLKRRIEELRRVSWPTDADDQLTDEIITYVETGKWIIDDE